MFEVSQPPLLFHDIRMIFTLTSLWCSTYQIVYPLSRRTITTKRAILATRTALLQVTSSQNWLWRCESKFMQAMFMQHIFQNLWYFLLYSKLHKRVSKAYSNFSWIVSYLLFKVILIALDPTLDYYWVNFAESIKLVYESNFSQQCSESFRGVVVITPV